ncbi:hypothetical protein ILUMI_03201, partial [Ignelater luminosus]
MDNTLDKSDLGTSTNQGDAQSNYFTKTSRNQSLPKSSLPAVICSSERRSPQVRFDVPDYYPSTDREEQVEIEVSTIDLEPKGSKNSSSECSNNSVQTLVINIDHTIGSSCPIICASSSEVYFNVTFGNAEEDTVSSQRNDYKTRPSKRVQQEVDNVSPEQRLQVQDDFETRNSSAYSSVRSPTTIERPSTGRPLEQDDRIRSISPHVESQPTTDKQRYIRERQSHSKQTPSSEREYSFTEDESPPHKSHYSSRSPPSSSARHSKYPPSHSSQMETDTFSKQYPRSISTYSPETSPSRRREPSYTSSPPPKGQSPFPTSYPRQTQTLPSPKRHLPDPSHYQKPPSPKRKPFYTSEPSQTETKSFPQMLLAYLPTSDQIQSFFQRLRSYLSSLFSRIETKKLLSHIPCLPTNNKTSLPSSKQKSHLPLNAGGRSIRRPINEQQREHSVPPDNQTFKSDKVEDDPVNRYNYVIVYSIENNSVPVQMQYLLTSLEQSGLELKSVRGEQNDRLMFVLLHLPVTILLRDVRKQRIPLSFMLETEYPQGPSFVHWITTCFAKREKQSKEEASPQFVTNAEKIMFIHKKVNRVQFTAEPEDYGIEEMIRRGLIKAAYPMHDMDTPPESSEPLSERQILIASWGKLSQYAHVQPLKLVNRYFGPEVAFYFAWMGYLACFLIPVALLCIIVFLFALPGMNDSNKSVVDQVCNTDGYMCPLCKNHEHCDFSIAKDSCFYGKLNYVFDNVAGYWVLHFVAIWAIIFVIYWKRAQNELNIEWYLYRTDTDHYLRSGFLKQLRILRIPPPSKGEPRMPFWLRCILRMLSMTAMMILILIIWKTVLAIGQIRISLMHNLAARLRKQHGANISLVSYGSYYSNITCSIISGVIIIAFSKILTFVVRWLTLLENPRTDKEYSISYINKLFILECLNNYGVAIHLTFLR